ncbi:hypothetical protein ACWKSP_01340 [Micromonosporaceae bacterium Da 78-11]
MAKPLRLDSDLGHVGLMAIVAVTQSCARHGQWSGGANRPHSVEGKCAVLGNEQRSTEGSVRYGAPNFRIGSTISPNAYSAAVTP